MAHVSKHHTRVSEQTNLHLFEHLEAMNPVLVINNVQHMNARTRWLLVMLFASLMLLVSVYGLTRIGINYLEATRGPFLFEALQAPYDVESRTVVTVNEGNESSLPNQIGDFTLQPVETSSVDTQIITNPITACVMSPAETDSNCQSIAGQGIFTGKYQSQSNLETVDMIAVRFGTHQEASEAAKQTFQYVTSVSQIGNYTLGTEPVDYYFSQFQGVYSMTWTKDVWLYSASSNSFRNVEQLVKALP